MEQGSKNLAAIPLLCANNCGFFGSPATNNLCSKCFRDHLRRGLAAASSSGDAPPRPTSAPAPEEEEEEKKKAKNRCACCNKKVGLMGFECRCGEVFCGAHRYSDKHECAYDYKGAGQDAIARANPVVKADKLDKF